MAKLRVGLVGLGRLGHLYAGYLATQIPEVLLIGVAGRECDAIVARYPNIKFAFTDRSELIAHPEVEAVVICSSTDTHVQFVREALEADKAVFCEKPIALGIEAARSLIPVQNEAHQRGHGYFQMGFMRRFDGHYSRAHDELCAGAIGKPVIFKATSRDKTRTSITYAKTSGGLLFDMGIHDFDLARWFMGEVASVHTAGRCLVYPELARDADDIDNAIVTVGFATGNLGMIDLSRNAVFGYDVCTEILGTEGAIRIGEIDHGGFRVLLDRNVQHGVIPSFMERFEEAFPNQLQNFARNVLAGNPSPCTLNDGIAALRIATAAQRSMILGRTINIAEV